MFSLTDSSHIRYCSHMAEKDGYTVFVECLNTAININGSSRKKIAAKAGIHEATLTRILKGERTATVKTFFSLAEALDINPIRLIDGSLCKECLKS